MIKMIIIINTQILLKNIYKTVIFKVTNKKLSFYNNKSNKNNNLYNKIKIICFKNKDQKKFYDFVYNYNLFIKPFYYILKLLLKNLLLFIFY